MVSNGIAVALMYRMLVWDTKPWPLFSWLKNGEIYCISSWGSVETITEIFNWKNVFSLLFYCLYIVHYWVTWKLTGLKNLLYLIFQLFWNHYHDVGWWHLCGPWLFVMTGLCIICSPFQDFVDDIDNVDFFGFSWVIVVVFVLPSWWWSPCHWSCLHRLLFFKWDFIEHINFSQSQGCVIVLFIFYFIT